MIKLRFSQQTDIQSYLSILKANRLKIRYFFEWSLGCFKGLHSVF